MFKETIYAGRDNSFSVFLIQDEVPIDLMLISKIELHIPDIERVFSDPSLFLKKADGEIEIFIGKELTQDEAGFTANAHILTFDPVNLHGIRWPEFKLKIKDEPCKSL